MSKTEATPLTFAEDPERVHVQEESIKSPVFETKRQKYFRIFCTVTYFIYALYILLILGFGGILRQSQRAFINIVAVPLQRDLRVNDQIFGTINGPLFSFFSAIAGLSIGRLTDLYSRKWNLVFLFILSGIATSLHGLCTKIWHLVACRALLAIGLSGLTPISMSLLPDYFSERARASVIGIWNIFAFMGGGITFVFGRFVDTNTSNWKIIFMAMGVPSILLGFLSIITMYEPEKGALDSKKDVQQVSTWVALKYLLTNTTVWCLNICAGLCFLATNSAQVWGPTFYQRVHGLSPKDLSSYLSWTAPIGGVLGTVLGGLLADRLTKISNRFFAVICTVGIFCAIPLQAVAYLVPNGIASALMTLPTAFVAMTVIPSMYLLTIKVTPLAVRSLATSWFMLFLGGIGSFGPMIVGFMNDVNFPIFDSKPNPLAVRWSLVTMTTGSFTLACFFALIMFFVIPRDFRRLEEWIEEHKPLVTPSEQQRESSGIVNN